MKHSLFILYCFWSVNSFSEPVNQSKSTAVEVKEKTFTESIIEIHKTYSKKLMIPTNWIDSFFGEKKSLEEQNGTRIDLYYTASKFEGEEVDYGPAFKIRVKLPNIEKKLQLNFEKRSENEKQFSTSTSPVVNEDEKAKKNDYSTGASILLKETLKFSLKFSAGFRINIPPKLYAKLRATNDINISKKWKGKIFSSTFWEQEDGYGQLVSADLENNINNFFTFRWINSSTWLDIDDRIHTSHGPSLFHNFSNSIDLSYNARANYVNRPNYHLFNYNFTYVFKQNIISDWFFYQIIPELNFDRDNSFKASPGLTVRFEVSIGRF